MFLAAVLVASVASAAANRPIAVMRFGDDPRWAQKDFDDSDWTPLASEGLPMRTGIVWVRLHVSRAASSDPDRRSPTFFWPADRPGEPVDSVYLSPAFSFDLYWDGHLIDRNGVVGRNAAEEKAGTLNRLVRIPPDLLGPGEHVAALRVSSYHYNFPATRTAFHLTMENYERRLIFEARRPTLPLIAVGGALLVAGMCVVFYFLVEGRRPLLIGALLGIALALFYGLIALRWLFNLTYDWHCPRLTAITAVMTVIAILLPWMLLEQFSVPKVKLWLAALIPLLVGAWMSSWIYEEKVLWLCRAMLVVSVVAVGWATWRRRPGAWFVLIGLVAGLIAVRTSRRAFLDPSFFLLLEVLVLFPLAALGLQLRTERRRAREATLAAARLETELLKKNIQPHFLINTLATIMEVIEREPRNAITLIESLASEFRILARVSGERLIPLQQEIALCRAHLEIMSLRKDARCTLVTEGVDEQAMVPPALFHTLVENGLTHLRPRGGAQRFTLRAEQTGEHLRYILEAEGDPVRAPRPGAAPSDREGTGLRYLKARLEESFAGRWTLASERTEHGWRTIITLAETSVETSATTLFPLPSLRSSEGSRA